MELGADCIAVDAGSTDSGPSALSTGKSKMSAAAIRRDIHTLLSARGERKIPVLIGSCGTSGCDEAVDWTLDIVREVAAELGLSPKIAVLYSEIQPDVLISKLLSGQTAPLSPATALDEDRVRSCAHIVGLMGPEPYIEALVKGADIVLGGRTTDAAVLAAYPLKQGVAVGTAWHAGKIGECGGLCTENPRGGGILIRFGSDSFEIEPLAEQNRCTPRSVFAHMLYENSHPYLLNEPGGTLEANAAKYVSVNDRTVKVSGAVFAPKPYTMKLEGAGRTSFQTLMMVGIADPEVIAQFDDFIEDLQAKLEEQVRTAIGSDIWFDLSLRAYGWNALTGKRRAEAAVPPPEVGLLLVVTSETQELATTIAKTCNPIFFHFPRKPGIPLPSYGFPFSPAEIERGAVHEFKLNHVVYVDSPFEMVRTETLF